MLVRPMNVDRRWEEQSSMIHALVFDFDGLLVDTESPAYQSCVEIYQEYQCEFPLTHSRGDTP